MDKEQIKELKPGDEVLIRGRFEKIKENGDFQASYLLTTVHGKFYMYKTAVHPSSVIIKSPPKYDPCRPFKKGDKVRVVEWNGRKVHDPLNGAVWTVNRNEGNGGISHESILVSLFYEDDKEGHIIGVPPCYLELVTPVEELEPYRVVKEAVNFVYVEKDGDEHPAALFNKKIHPNAEEAAKAERDRLNAEWRKEQNNG